MSLEEQVNKAYARLRAARSSLAELQEWDYSRMESCQIRSIEDHKRVALANIESAQMEIDRLSLVIQARLAEKQDN